MKLQGEKLLVTLNVHCSQQTTDWVWSADWQPNIIHVSQTCSRNVIVFYNQPNLLNNHLNNHFTTTHIVCWLGGKLPRAVWKKWAEILYSKYLPPLNKTVSLKTTKWQPSGNRKQYSQDLHRHVFVSHHSAWILELKIESLQCLVIWKSSNLKEMFPCNMSWKRKKTSVMFHLCSFNLLQKL